MRSYCFILGAGLLGALACAGCSSGSDSAAAAVDPGAAFEGAWILTCTQQGETNYGAGSVTFSGSTLSQVAAAYSDASCETLTETNDFTARFALGSPFAAMLGSTQVTAVEIDYAPTSQATVYSALYLDASTAPHRLHVGINTDGHDGATRERRHNTLSTWFLEKQ